MPGSVPPFSLGSLWREVGRLGSLGFPIVVSLAAATLISVVDTVMISPLGTVPLAAASVTGAAMLIFYAGLYGFVSVIGVRMAEAFGRKDEAALTTATKTGLIVAGVGGVAGMAMMLSLKPLLFVLEQPPEVLDAATGYYITMALLLVPFALFYTLKGLFDAIDAPWIGVALAFLAVFLNIPANWVLIHGVGDWQGLGLLGAGIASLLSESVSLVLAVIIWRRARVSAPARADAPVSARERRTQIKEGTTIAIGYIGEGGAYSFASLMMGWFGAVALAANQIVSSIGGVLYMVPLGISIAVSLRIGQAIGADERARLPRIGLAALLVIIAWMTLVMITVLLAGGVISQALSDDPPVVALATGLFLVIALMQVFDGVQGTMTGACRGMMDNRVPVTITLICYWIVALPVGYWLGFHAGFGPKGVWIGYGLGLALAAGLLTWRFFAKSGRT